MTSVLRRFAVSSVLLAAGLIAAAGQAQTEVGPTPQNGVWQTGSRSLSRSTSVTDASAPAATASGKSSGASSWSAGRGSFGAQGIMPGANSPGKKMTGAIAPPSGSSSWTAGRGSFGSATQSNGIWRDRAPLARTLRSGATAKPATGLYTPSASRNFTGAPPAFRVTPMTTPASHAAAPRSAAGTHAGSRTHLNRLNETSRMPRGSALGRTGTKSIALGPRSRMGTHNQGKTSIGAGTEPSRLGSTTQTPLTSKPTSSSSTEGASDEDGPSQAPQQ